MRLPFDDDPDAAAASTPGKKNRIPSLEASARRIRGEIRTVQDWIEGLYELWTDVTRVASDIPAAYWPALGTWFDDSYRRYDAALARRSALRRGLRAVEADLAAAEAAEELERVQRVEMAKIAERIGMVEAVVFAATGRPPPGSSFP
ncbi:hypothetical protein U9M48_029612 [Paspalum notatum var. saurae]|uniref:Uncharacterized protein n=1 Tax=Paspalum notatum var. saurae TaxID=547442 RepID=A0AAQ3U1B9_PASNO